MRDWPMPRMSFNSATESSSCSSSKSSRNRVGSASSRRKLMVDAIVTSNDISTYHDRSICYRPEFSRFGVQDSVVVLVFRFHLSPIAYHYSLFRMSHRYIFSSESVTEGHPDIVCDTISDYILDACLDQDPLSRVACETLAKGNLVVLAGEITSNAKFDFEERVREAV